MFIGTGPVPGHGSIFCLASQMYALSMPSPNAFSKNKSGKEAYKIGRAARQLRNRAEKGPNDPAGVPSTYRYQGLFSKWLEH